MPERTVLSENRRDSMTRNLVQHKKSALILGTALTVLSFGNALAQEKKQETVQLKEIIVTAGRTPIEEGKTGRAVTVITGKQLEQNQVRYVADALRMVPGFAVSRTGSYGGLTQVRVRGAEANQLMVMVDGVEAGNPGNGEFDFGGLLASDIDRIEVLRGPQSAFWGAGAAAGVVNIITKGGNRDGFKVSGTTEAGSRSSWLGGVQLQGGAESYDMALGATYRTTKGFNITDIGDEKDGARSLALNGKINIDLSDTVKLDATLRYTKNRTDTDVDWSPVPQNSVGAYDETSNFMGSLGLTWTGLDDALTQKLRFSGNATEYQSNTPIMPVYETKGRRYKGAYQASYVFDTPAFADAHHTVTGGVEWTRETFETTKNYERDSYGFVGQYNGEYWDQFYLNLALRHDVNDEFKDATTYSLSTAWSVPDTNARLHSSIGTGNTNPTFFEQFGTTTNFVGNPNLKPEKSFGWDAGLEYSFFNGLLITDVTYFIQNLTNEIQGSSQTVTNLDGKSKRHGVELAATLNLFHGFTAGGTYTYTSSRAPTGEQATRRPRHSGSLNVAYTFYEDRARMFGEAVFNGNMKDNNFGTFPASVVTLNKHTIVNIGGSYKFTDKLEGYARIENLFDKKYQEVYGYNTPGRGAFAGLKASF
ncbi:vitamin B12 transporter [Pseudochrobactrum asaccharolyticum]|uniref:Heme transporter BhuA n=2 Tax=Pseudochrobactrum asaccharolyticum TaxID=354351 RepID=A0A366E5F2_9HYPH|nr:vitamin B12 transporter [Pseudochrobactrum asaccharolyticum]